MTERTGKEQVLFSALVAFFGDGEIAIDKLADLRDITDPHFKQRYHIFLFLKFATSL
jgi:hypothetical protein